MKPLQILVLLLASTSVTLAGHPVQVVQQTNVVAVPTGQIVTEFAVPVAVPVYAATVAPQSAVTYGANSTATPRSDMQEIRQQIAELKAMLTDGAKSGAVTGLSLPSIVRSKCAGCHNGTNPKTSLDLRHSLDQMTAEERNDAIARMVSDDDDYKMPKPGATVTITAQELGEMIKEFSRPSKSTK